MAAHYRQISGVVEVFAPGKCFANRDAYDGVVSVIWLDTETVILCAAHGENHGTHLNETVATLAEYGAKTFRATRAKGHKMPRPWRRIEQRENDSLWELSLEDICAKG